MMIKKIIGAIKLLLLIAPSVVGYWFFYALMWYALELPPERWSVLVWTIFAVLSECAFLKWVVTFE